MNGPQVDPAQSEQPRLRFLFRLYRCLQSGGTVIRGDTSLFLDNRPVKPSRGDGVPQRHIITRITRIFLRYLLQGSKRYTECLVSPQL